MFRFALLFLVVVEVCSLECMAAPKNSPNVLFIAVDDLRCDLGCYGASHVRSPNIDRFAMSAMRFDRAYCQQAVCNPSRTSLMTGMRPDATGVTGSHAHFRDQHPDIVTLPEFFKKHGYHSAAIGKIYHGVFPDGASNTKWDTMGDPQSWSAPALRFGPRYYFTEDGIASAKATFNRIYRPKNRADDDWTKKLVFGLATESPDVADEELYDGKVAKAAVERLRRLAENDTPFFLAVGFIKPHSPYIAPKKYFELYPNVPLAETTSFPLDAPAFAGHRSSELRRYTDQPKRAPFDESNQRRVRQAYFACVSFIDAQIGKVLEELERSGLSENTIVVLFGDHGYHLGEQNLWGKTTNFELDTRVPLIVRSPNMKSVGQSTQSLVELVDLYPTITQLAGLPKAKHLQGTSFGKTLDDPSHKTKQIALSQYPRGNLMGYSMRTDTHRLTQWVEKQTGKVRATELYDYRSEPIEKTNIAAESEHLVAQLCPQLATAFEIANKPNSEALSFEQQKPGAFQILDTFLGTWNTTTGQAVVDNKHSKTGRQCLQLTGGTKTSVTLDLADGIDTSGELTFWAERWTRREPFSFRIEKNRGQQWEEIYNGDRDVRVGRAFLSHVKVPLGDQKIDRLRLTVTSPPKTGVLIDDIRVTIPQRQTIVSTTVEPTTLPALVGTKASPLLKLKVVATGSLSPISFENVSFTTEGTTDLADVDSWHVYQSQSDQFSSARLIGSTNAIREQSRIETIRFGKRDNKQDCKLAVGDNYLWLAATLNRQANIDHRIGVNCKGVKFSNGKSVKLDGKPSVQRMGVSVRDHGDDDVHTYRIPGLVTTTDGTLIAVYDARRRSSGDLPSDIDVGMSRSLDGGRTWEPMKIIMDLGDDPKWRYDGIGDPAILVDETTGIIWVAATWSHGNRSWHGSGPGMLPEETGQLMLVRSDDDGVTWSKPINITAQVKKPEWSFLLQGPGRGITMCDGTIVFAAQYRDSPENDKLPHSTIIYSRDYGETWKVGTGAFDDTTEAQVVEINPGILMLNCRYNRTSTRVVMTSGDYGQTWQEHATSRRSLIEPRACMGSLIDTGSVTLFSNPDSTSGRNHITIKASMDQARNWLKENRLLLDEGNSRGYSCMTMIDPRTVGIIYEGSQAEMTFQRIPLKDISGERQRARSSKEKPVPSELRLASVFGNHMVLQADAPIPIWGEAQPGSSVSVQFNGKSKTTVANEKGRWQVNLDVQEASHDPRELRVESDDQDVRFTDVLVGEVWLCAGQSNMEWPLAKSELGSKTLESPMPERLRLLHLVGGALGSSGIYSTDHLSRLTPDNFCKGEWRTATPASARDFSAVAFYFGQHLERELDVPVGLICPAVGGTPTESWISDSAIWYERDLREMVDRHWLDNELLGEFCRSRGAHNLTSAMQSGEFVPYHRRLGPYHSFQPGFMWSAAIEPLIPFGMRGVIWYQGESNAESLARVQQHRKLFPLLVQQWRKEWKQGDFPFLFVQLPALNRPQWPAFRESQRQMLEAINNSAMAVTIDTGHPSNVHPTAKKPVGTRLAQLALAQAYKQRLETSRSAHVSPLPEPTFVRKKDKLVVQFRNVGNGLKSSDGKVLRHFEIAGSDQTYHQATAEITSANTVAVHSELVPQPRSVRYGWSPYPDPPVNLVNDAGLPASPFELR